MNKTETKRTYIAIDLKSYFASVECVERNKNPLTTNLVVADVERTEKTICLAVSPSLKAYGLPGRARLFEVIQKVTEINIKRRQLAPNHTFIGKSVDAIELKEHPELELSYITAVPRMSYYIDYSTRIYNIYLKYIAPEDIQVYSIDEVFIDATNYLASYKMTARELTSTIIHTILQETGITATAGIGTNLYLCKIAMDIVAKHIEADKNGVRIAELDEMSYRKLLWNHTPLTDFWRIGKGISQKLEPYGIFTMGDIARCSLEDEDFLYGLFGVNAELLIDHAWGWEPCTIDMIKNYHPETNSLSSGQVLQHPYDFKKARVVIKEMADALSLELVAKHLVTDQIVINLHYDAGNIKNETEYNGKITIDFYGRKVPKQAHGSTNLKKHTSSTKYIINATASLFDSIVDTNLLIRKLSIVANHVINENDAHKQIQSSQLDLFSDEDFFTPKDETEQKQEQKERSIQETILTIKEKFGKNAILKGLNYEEGATAKERNKQIGGHKA